MVSHPPRPRSRSRSMSPRPPYPLSSAEIAELERRNTINNINNDDSDDSWGSDSDSEPAQKEKGRLGLPDALKPGRGRSPERRTSEEMRRDYDRGDVPELLRPGGGRASGEFVRPGSRGSGTPVPGVLRPGTGRKSEEMQRPGSRSEGMVAGQAQAPMKLPLSLGKVGEMESFSRDVREPQKGILGRSPEQKKAVPMSGALPVGNGEVVQYPPPSTAQQQRMMTGSSSSSSPPVMGASLTSFDRPFNEYSSSYTPPPPPPPLPQQQQEDIFGPLPNIDSRHTSVSSGVPKRAEKDRNYSIASTGSSAYDPGVDLSGFDASFSRAMPGQRDVPPVGMDGWKDVVQEDVPAKTWEEDLERRAKAGAELQKRAEQAHIKEREDGLAKEFWDTERNTWDEQADLKPKTTPLVVGSCPPAPLQPTITGSTNPWGDETGVPPVPAVVPPPPPGPPSRQLTPPPEAGRNTPQPSAESSSRAPHLAIDPTSEIYQIKHINVLLPSTAPIRRLPILLQNANGPCPLMALVNAITLSSSPSSPSSPAPPILNTLCLREQISLSLLISTVIEELLHRQSSSSSTPLPDISELFTFLQTLHTGMNVNPAFIPPGTFEQTPQMELYRIFAIPLIHGWIPPPNSPITTALARSAKTYDDAMSLQFLELEAISRVTALNAAPASEADQNIITDAAIVKDFLDSTPTQLTTHGLQSLRKNIPDGSVAILFRNDHFSTVTTRNGELYGLVTDMGFATHQEVVWERIADVQSHGNEYLSGDFRPVGGSGDASSPSSQRYDRQRPAPPPPPRDRNPPPPRSSMLEPDQPLSSHPPQQSITGVADEDYDLALAMQLQEEEDQRARNNRGSTPPPPLPARDGVQVGGRRRRASHGGGAGMGRAGAEEDMPPPPYERVDSASEGRASGRRRGTVPPGGYGGGQGIAQGGWANGRNSGGGSSGMGGNGSNGVGQHGGKSKKDCVIM